jgi:hypothetical protein
VWLWVIGFTSSAWAQGALSFWATGGLTKVELGSGRQAPTHQPAYGGGMAFTGGGGDKRSAFLFGVSTYYLDYRGEPTVSMRETFSATNFGAAVSMGWRIGNAGFGGIVEGRQAFVTVSEADAGSDPGTARLLLYGPYLSVGLGRPGSSAGRFRIEGRYLWGSGNITDVDPGYFGLPGASSAADLLSIPAKSASDLRLRLAFAPSPKVLLRLEYLDEKITAEAISDQGYALVAPGAIDRRNRGILFSVGISLTLGS